MPYPFDKPEQTINEHQFFCDLGGLDRTYHLLHLFLDCTAISRVESGQKHPNSSEFKLYFQEWQRRAIEDGYTEEQLQLFLEKCFFSGKN